MMRGELGYQGWFLLLVSDFGLPFVGQWFHVLSFFWQVVFQLSGLKEWVLKAPFLFRRAGSLSLGYFLLLEAIGSTEVFL